MDKKLVIERVFNAPIEKVWAAWTQPEILQQWSSPDNMSLSDVGGELKVGSEWHSTMKGDGFEMKLGGVYKEITKPYKLVSSHVWYNADGSVGEETEFTVELTSEGSKTRMLFTQTGFASNDSKQGHNGGWQQCFDKLAPLVQ